MKTCQSASIIFGQLVSMIFSAIKNSLLQNLSQECIANMEIDRAGKIGLIQIVLTNISVQF
jgi:hypothetical protein